MLLFIIKIFAFLFAIFVLIIIHEYGHFLVARRFRVRILRFSIGFGKAIFSWHGKDNTEYVIAAVPLGGYVKMLDGREMEVKKQDQPFAFDKKPLLQRMLIILAGPVTNIIFSIIIFWLVFVIGLTLPKPIIGKIIPNSIAQQAGLHAGDEIVAVANKKASNWQQVALPILARIGDKGELAITAMRKSLPDARQITTTHYLDLAAWRLDDLQPDPLKDLGLVPYEPPIPLVIKEVEKNSPADRIKLQARDMILAVDGKRMNDWQQFVEYTKDKPNQQVDLTIKRGEQILYLKPTLDWRLGKRWKKVGYLGVRFPEVAWPKDMVRKYKYSVFYALLPTLSQVWEFTTFNYIILGKLLTGKISLHILGGPITIFQSAAMALQEGIIVYMGFLAILSLLLALINLIPIPGLDGGYILFLLIELLRGKPISVAAQSLILRIGLVVIILLMLQATINDLMRVF